MSLDAFQLVNKTICVIGASSGIGRATCLAAAEQGATVFAAARNRVHLEETLSLLPGDGHSLIEMDITDEASLKTGVDCLPKLDGIVFSAGILQLAAAKYITTGDLERTFATNVFGQISLMSLLLQKKKINNRASIVFISSLAGGRVAWHGNGIYSASKGAVSSYSKVLALELSNRKVRVNSVLPGMIHTDFYQNAGFTEDMLEADMKLYPLGYGFPEDVANAIVFLLADASKWITGTELVLDGGLTLR